MMSHKRKEGHERRSIGKAETDRGAQSLDNPHKKET
jgi:hypothetical protein